MHSIVDLTFAHMSAPEVARDPISGEFWLTWRKHGTRIDVVLGDKDELRTLVRNALEAASDPEHETITQPL